MVPFAVLASLQHPAKRVGVACNSMYAEYLHSGALRAGGIGLTRCRKSLVGQLANGPKFPFRFRAPILSWYKELLSCGRGVCCGHTRRHGALAYVLPRHWHLSSTQPGWAQPIVAAQRTSFGRHLTWEASSHTQRVTFTLSATGLTLCGFALWGIWSHARPDPHPTCQNPKSTSAQHVHSHTNDQLGRTVSGCSSNSQKSRCNRTYRPRWLQWRETYREGAETTRRTTPSEQPWMNPERDDSRVQRSSRQGTRRFPQCVI